MISNKSDAVITVKQSQVSHVLLAIILFCLTVIGYFVKDIVDDVHWTKSTVIGMTNSLDRIEIKITHCATWEQLNSRPAGAKGLTNSENIAHTP